MSEKLTSVDITGASVTRGGMMNERAEIHGHYVAECFDADGNLKWSDKIDNLVTTFGKNDLLDKFLGMTTNTAFFLGLISSVSYGAGPNVADTMTSHAGWTEAGGVNAPTYSGTRGTPTFAAASGGSKTTSAAVAFSITGTGTVNGCFLNASGTSAIANTTGVLYSAGTFTGGPKSVGLGDTLNVTYTASV